MHTINMRNKLKEPVPEEVEGDISQLPSKKKPLPEKSILKKTNSELYIHSDIEWNEDKKYLRDPVVNQKVIKAREEHIKRMKEKATLEYEMEKEKLELSSQSSTDSEKDGKFSRCSTLGAKYDFEDEKAECSKPNFDGDLEKGKVLFECRYYCLLTNLSNTTSIDTENINFQNNQVEGCTKLSKKRSMGSKARTSRRVCILDEDSGECLFLVYLG